MNEMARLIDKKYDQINSMPLFVKYFENVSLEQIEEDDDYFIENAKKGIDIIFSRDLIVKAILYFPVSLNHLISTGKCSPLICPSQ
jgi:hypothetical protein